MSEACDELEAQLLAENLLRAQEEAMHRLHEAMQGTVDMAQLEELQLSVVEKPKSD